MATKDHHDNDKTPEEARARIWELAKKIDICMFTTWDGERQRSRPLSARVIKEEHAIHFLVDEDGAKNWQVEKFPFVSCAWADNDGHKYVVISGSAVVTNDRAKIKELWGVVAKAWWDSPEDPNIRVLKVRPNDAEYWDSPGTVVSYIKMAAAAVTNTRPAMGDNKKVPM